MKERFALDNRVLSGEPLPPPPFSQDYPLQDYISGFANTRKWDILALWIAEKSES